MNRRATCALLVLFTILGCRERHVEIIVPAVEPTANTETTTSPGVAAEPLSLPPECKEDEIIDQGKCIPKPAKCKSDEVYLAYLDQCVADNPANACFARGMALKDGSCAANAFYATCILKTGRTAAQDALLTQLKTVVADNTCEGSEQKLMTMTDLNLSGKKQAFDLRLLGDFTGLTTLNLRKNILTGLSGLEKMRDLTELDVSYNQLTDITAVALLTHIKTLDLSHNALVDIAPLRNMSTATDVELSSNKIKTLPSLSRLVSVNDLDLSDNKDLKDISTLATLSSLRKLALENTKVSSLGDLKNLDLSELKVAGADVADKLPEDLSESTCPVETALSDALYTVCATLRGI